jgi:HD-GYP domain-containing protein (c-di-GMP phosphodiesterase class II)
MSMNYSGRSYYVGLLQALTQVLGSAKGYLSDHGPRVALLASHVGDRMGLSWKESSGLFFASILSDLGMIGLAEEAWENPVPYLPGHVRSRVRRHPVRSEARVRLIPHLETLGPLVRHHHEWWNGTGYPDGLVGKEIPLGAQILRLADTVTALGQARPHRSALDSDGVYESVDRAVEVEFGPEVGRTYLSLHKAGDLPVYRPSTFRRQLSRAARHLLPDEVSPLSSDQLLSILANLIDAKDPYTAGHSRRVAMLAVAVGSQLGFHGHMRSPLWAGGYLHDLGKLSVPLRILTKDGTLSRSEFERLKAHPADGADILETIGTLKHLAPGARYHHERWDGSGYPDGLGGDDIPLVGQIFAVCDSYDAMTSRRAYRDSRPHESAIQEIARCSGTHFSPRVCEAFLGLQDYVFQAVKAESRASRLEAPVELPLFPSPMAAPQGTMAQVM